MQKRNAFTSSIVVTLIWCCSAANVKADPLLNGVATHTELGTEQFIAGLYASTLTTDAKSLLLKQEEKRMQVRVTAESISPRRFRRMWIEGMAINASSAELEQHSEDMAEFSNMLRVRLAAGDIFTIDRTQSEVDIIINGTKLGTINNTSFFDLLLRTWIGPVPLSSNFRDSLLKAGDINGELLARFEATRPSDERIAAIEEVFQTNRNPDNASQQVAQIETQRIKEPDSLRSQAALPPPPAALSETTTVVSRPVISDLAPAVPVVAAKPAATPTPAPVTQLAVAAPALQQNKSKRNSVLDEEDDEEFTAASLLLQQRYIAELKRWSNKHTEYPDRALKRNQEGTVRLGVTIDRNGNVIKSEIIGETQYPLLDRGALKIVEKASPYPKIPDEISGDSFYFTFPILFQIKDS